MWCLPSGFVKAWGVDIYGSCVGGDCDCSGDWLVVVVVVVLVLVLVLSEE